MVPRAAWRAQAAGICASSEWNILRGVDWLPMAGFAEGFFTRDSKRIRHALYVAVRGQASGTSLSTR
jgi:hypothetical protein